MNLENIKEKQIFKNYKELCTALGEQIKYGNSKVSQIAEWERYFKFSKDGHKIIIKKIYDNPKTDVKLLSIGKYGKYLSTILLNMIAKKGGKDIIITNNELYYQLGLTNYKYKNRKIGNDFEYTLGETNQESAKLKHFFQDTNNQLNRVVECFLKTLVNNGLITVDKTFIITKDKIESQKYNLATKQEHDAIKNVIDKGLKNFKCNNEWEIFIKGYTKQYKTIIQDTLRNKNHITGYCRVYKIHPCDIDIIISLLEKKNIEKEKVNKLICEKLKNNCVKTYYRQLEKNKNGNSNFMFNRDFIIEQNLLIEYFVNLKYFNAKKSLTKIKKERLNK